jgi:uncharacterized membrane protein YidH (DUF202 family)
MKYADWRYLATICTVLGVILLIGGVIVNLYSQTSYFRGTSIGTTYPYRGYTIPFIVFGIILLVIGVASFARAGEERKLEVERPKPVSVSLKKCPKCGMKFSLEYEYCPTCGAKLQSA